MKYDDNGQKPMKVPVITIDGPSGTGKGTLCKMLANHFRWHRLDSGCIYRALAFAAKAKKIDFNDKKELVKLAHALDLRFETDPNGKEYIFLEEKNIFDDIRSEQCGLDASQIAVIPEIRTALLVRQRAFAMLPGLVTDGRDMGTIVFPDALLKIYLDATPEERALRRYLQLKESGINASLAKVIEDSVQRDIRDSSRKHAPLKPAPDAVSIDTTGLTIAQMFDKVVQLMDKKLLIH